MDEREARLWRVASFWAGCQACDLARAGRRQVVQWRGDKGARLAVVGEAPGEREDVQGVPFCGPSGALLDQMLAQAGADEVGVFVANVVGCRPPGNRQPTPAEVKACRVRLESLLCALDPGAVVLVGGTAAKALAGVASVTAWRGEEVAVEVGWRGGVRRYRAIPTFHPAFLLRQGRAPALVSQVIGDLAKAVGLAKEAGNGQR